MVVALDNHAFVTRHPATRSSRASILGHLVHSPLDPALWANGARRQTRSVVPATRARRPITTTRPHVRAGAHHCRTDRDDSRQPQRHRKPPSTRLRTASRPPFEHLASRVGGNHPQAAPLWPIQVHLPALLPQNVDCAAAEHDACVHSVPDNRPPDGRAPTQYEDGRRHRDDREATFRRSQAAGRTFHPEPSPSEPSSVSIGVPHSGQTTPGLSPTRLYPQLPHFPLSTRFSLAYGRA